LNLTGSLEDSQNEETKRQNAIQKRQAMIKLTSKLTPALGVAGLAFTALTGHAQVFQYNDADLILDFSKAGSADLEIDIGNISSLTSAAAANGGSVALSGQLGDYNITSQLLGTFGSTAGLAFSVFGYQANATGPGTQNENWLSKVQTGASPIATPGDWTPTKASTINSGIGGALGLQGTSGILTWSAANPADPVGNTANVAVIPTSGVQSIYSYTAHASGITGVGGTIANHTTYVSDLFGYGDSGAGTPATYEGNFTFDPTSGDTIFSSASPVPEPGAYGILAGAGLLAVTLRRQFGLRQA
jgi:hypothetical protein